MKKILDFGNRSYSDVSGKYQNMEKPLKHQRRLGLAVAQPRVSRKKSSMLTPKVAKLIVFCTKTILNIRLYKTTISLVLGQPRKTRPCFTERLLTGRKESNKQIQNHCMAIRCELPSMRNLYGNPFSFKIVIMI